MSRKALIHQYQVVSEEVAIMATEPAKSMLRLRIEATGFAGPTGEHNFPIGSIYLGYASPLGVGKS